MATEKKLEPFEVETENALGQRQVHRVDASSEAEARKAVELPEGSTVLRVARPGEGAGRV